MSKINEAVVAKQVTEIKKSRQRSPNYPAIGLQKALERLQPIKEQAGRHFMPIEVAYVAWDYKAAAGNQTVAALSAFGLVEVRGVKDKREIRLTEAAWRILGNAPDRAELLRVAALKPEIHKKIWEKYEGLPPADAILKNYLVWELHFNQTFVDNFITQLRGTIAFANITSSDNLPGEDSEHSESEETTPMQQATRTDLHVGPKAESFGTPQAPRRLTDFRQMTELAFKLSKEADAKITIYGDASQEAIKKLQELLKLSEDTFPTKAELYPKAKTSTENESASEE